MLEQIPGTLKIIALIGAAVVAIAALAGLRSEWKKTELEDQVTKVMMILLTVGCIFVALVAFGVWGRV
jgi:adenine/guanine phosphoribosyltransferase-like PRPP-binding protein